MTAAIEQVKAWTAPILAVCILALGGYIWTMQAMRIGSLETQLLDTETGVKIIQQNQADRKEASDQFYADTSKRLDAMSDVLAKVGDAVTRLTAIQEQSSKN